MDTARLDRIKPNPNQPRTHFDPAKMLELALTIHTNGLIQPITVDPADEDGYHTLTDGERRWRACCALAIAKTRNITPAPADDFTYWVAYVCRETFQTITNTHQAALEWEYIPIHISEKREISKYKLINAIVANEQHATLNPIELALAYDKLKTEHNYTDADLAELMGNSRSAVANTRRLLELPEEIRQLIAAGELTERHGRALLPLIQTLKQPEFAVQVAQSAARAKITVTRLEEDVNYKINTTLQVIPGQFRTLPAGCPVPHSCSVACADCAHQVLHNKVERCAHPGGFAHARLRIETAQNFIKPAPPPEPAVGQPLPLPPLPVWMIQTGISGWMRERKNYTIPLQREFLERVRDSKQFVWATEWINDELTPYLNRTSALSDRPVTKNSVIQAVNNLIDSLIQRGGDDCPQCLTKKAMYTNGQGNPQCYLCLFTIKPDRAEPVPLPLIIDQPPAVSPETPAPAVLCAGGCGNKLLPNDIKLGYTHCKACADKDINPSRPPAGDPVLARFTLAGKFSKIIGPLNPAQFPAVERWLDELAASLQTVV